MSSFLQPHTNVSMRTASDKDIEVFDLDSLFDQYVESGVPQPFSDTTAQPSGPDDLAHLFDLPSSSGSEPIETLAMPDWDASSEMAWHKALHTLRQNPASPTLASNSFSIYPESHGNASLSEPEISNFYGPLELNQVSPRLSLSTPSSPKLQAVNTVKKATSSPDLSARYGIQKSSKKSVLSKITKMMRPSHYRSGFQDLWTRKIDGPADTFNLQLPPNGLSQTPPPSAKLVQDEHLDGFYSQDQAYTIAMSPLHGTELTTPDLNYQLTPLSSPSIDQNSRDSNVNSFQFSNDSMASAYISRHISSAALSALQTPPPSHRIAMGPWGPATPAGLDFAFPASSEFQSSNTGGKTPGWWNDHNVGVTQPPPTPTSNYLTSQSSSTSQNMDSFSTASVAGLGITCDTASFSGFEPELHTSETSNHDSFSTSASSFDMGYTTMYPQDNGYPIGQPLNRRRTTDQTPSPSPPLSPQPRFTRRRHSSNRAPASTTQHRRKSSNASSGQSTGRAPVGFVNYTPDDSRKILTGVAPSGSSKTKARREKEAADKRRKFSQAAVKAVMEAGGDLKRLEKEGLLVMGS